MREKEREREGLERTMGRTVRREQTGNTFKVSSYDFKQQGTTHHMTVRLEEKTQIVRKHQK